MAQSSRRAQAKARAALAAVEAHIGEAEAQLRAVSERLADPSLYRDGRAAADATREYAAIEERLRDLYARWEEAAEAASGP